MLLFLLFIIWIAMFETRCNVKAIYWSCLMYLWWKTGRLTKFVNAKDICASPCFNLYTKYIKPVSCEYFAKIRDEQTLEILHFLYLFSHRDILPLFIFLLFLFYNLTKFQVRSKLDSGCLWCKSKYHRLETIYIYRMSTWDREVSRK